MEDQRDAILRQRDELAQEIKRRRDAEQKEALQAELAKRRLGPFLRAVWHVVEKRDELQWNLGIEALCLHLEAVEAGRIRNIAISLPPGCLAGDSLVPVLSGQRWRPVAIGQLAADKPLWRSDPPCVPQPDGKGNLVPVRLRDVWPTGTKEVFRLRTRTGRVIRGTADHPFMVESATEPGDRPIFVKLGELVPGDRVCVDAAGRVGWEEVVSVSSAGHEPTFDLEVADDPHCFVANGFVVSNCTKTKLIMEAYPAWLLGRDPAKRVLCISNSEELGTKSSLACRDILKSDWYRKHFPHVVIAGDQDTKVMYRTTAGGYRLAKSVGSKIIGHKGDIIVCFPGETGILTDVGEVPIEQIVAAPERYRVATFNHDTSAIEFHGIVETFRSESVELIEIETADGHVMECTPEHPVFVIGKGYIPAQDIQEGDEVLAHESVPPMRQAVSDRPAEVLLP